MAMNNGQPGYDWVSRSVCVSWNAHWTNIPWTAPLRRLELPDAQFRYSSIFYLFTICLPASLILPCRGKLVGGSSALNYMAWDRASKEEYDAWKLVGDAEGGWDWDALLPFMRKAEDAASPSVNPDIAMTYVGSASDVSIDTGGVGGPVKVFYYYF